MDIQERYERCDICFFYEDRGKRLVCQRFPHALPTEADNWCGEFQVDEKKVEAKRVAAEEAETERLRKLEEEATASDETAEVDHD